MEYEQITQTEEVTHALPKWAKILFRFYAVIFLLGTSVFGVKLVQSAITNSQELLTLVSGSVVSISTIEIVVVFVFAAVILFLQVLYGIGIYRFKRWVLPLLLIFSFSYLLIGFLTLLNQNFATIFDLIYLLVGIIFMGAVGYAAIKYGKMFTGSARKLRIQIPLFFAFLPFILFATVSQIFTDDPHINDSDLMLQPVELLSQSNNAHYAFPDLENLSAQQQQSYEVALAYARELEGKNLNNEEAIDLANQTTDLTDAVIDASSKGDYQCPTSVNNYSFDAEICSLNKMRDLAMLTAFRAGVEADTGNKDQAIRTAVSIVQLGDLVGNMEQPVLIEYLVGIALMNIGLESLERTLRTTATTSNETIRSAISDLEQSKINDNAFADSLQREYMQLKDASKAFEQFSSYFYQPNKTLNQQAELFRMRVAMSLLGCDADTSQEQQAINRLVEEIGVSRTKWPIISPNFIGKVLNGVIAGSLYTAEEKGCEVNELNQRVQELLKNSITVDSVSQLDTE